MVVVDPLITGKWTVKKLRSLIIYDIWQEVTFFTLVATMVSLVSEMRVKLYFSNALLTVVGTVLGLVISFRTSSAYERFQDGRKMWTNIQIASRNIAHMVWIHVPVNRPDSPPPDAAEDEDAKAERLSNARLRAVIEKKSMINLVQAFGVAVKHFLRGEKGIYYEDLYPIVRFLPRYAVNPALHPSPYDTLPIWINHEDHCVSSNSTLNITPTSTMNSKNTKRSKTHKNAFDPEKGMQFESDVPLRGARNPPKYTIYDHFTLLLVFKPIFSGIRGLFRRKGTDEDVEAGQIGAGDVSLVDTDVPLEITLFLSSYVQWLLQRKYLEPAIATGLVTNLGMLQDTVANLDRVRTTPIPFAYQAHLRMSIWLYLFFLPFQIEQAMKYLTIPATAIAAFLFLGFLEIGQEIENPFNYDENDLDMDGFCKTIEREIHEIVAHPAPDPNSYVFSIHNQPFAPSDPRNAEEMALDLDHEYNLPQTGMHHVRRTLLRNWREVRT